VRLHCGLDWIQVRINLLFDFWSRKENFNVFLIDVKANDAPTIVLDMECVPMEHAYAKMDMKERIAVMDLINQIINTIAIIVAPPLVFLAANMWVLDFF
jgi:hypothetical protein